MVRGHIQTIPTSQCNSTGLSKYSLLAKGKPGDSSVGSVGLTFGVELVTATSHYSGESLLNGRAQVGGWGWRGEQRQTT